MQLRIINNVKSLEFTKTVELGDSNSKTLGFLPYVAFEKYAKKNQLIGAFEENNNELLGYLLYRVSFNRVTIIHCCIDRNHRNKNVAHKLVDYLKSKTKQYEGIRLSCRNDYGIDHVWESFNFVPVREKAGRGKKGLPLTIWWYPHYQANLLSQISDYELNNKIVAVIDMNVFLDIKDEREEESLALRSDWLLSEAILYVTREIHVEINRAATAKIKETSRTLLRYFRELPFRDEQEFLLLLEKIKTKFSNKNRNDKSDLNHLAYSILGGAQFFITRDKEIIKNKKFFEQYNLSIYRPSDFITHLDEITQVLKYEPQRLIGTTIKSKRVTSENINYFTNKFLMRNERKSHFQKIMRKALSYPSDFELITTSKEDELLAFVILDRSINNVLNIRTFRFLNSRLKNTLSKHLLYKIILSSINEQKMFVEISEKYLDDELISTIERSRFVKIDNKWQKINIGNVLAENNIPRFISESISNEKVTQKILKTITSKVDKNIENFDFFKKYNLERYLYPLKVEDLEIPTFVVPIKPQWAEILFDDKSTQKLALFEPDYQVLLNRENVYYRSAMPKIIESPSRVLWYISENKQTKEKGRIAAVSYVDEIFIDDPKKLFKQFEHLGVYKWNQISDTVGTKSKIMAFIFSDTELFRNFIPLIKLDELFKRMENKKFMVVTPVKVKTETYIALYKMGMGII